MGRWPGPSIETFRLLEQAVLDRSGRREGPEIRFRCPHPDQHQNGDVHPSARYNADKRVWHCDVCGAGGGWTDLARLLGVDIANCSSRARVATHYVYRDEQGQERRRKLRWEPGFDGRTKSFSWEKPNGSGGWEKARGDGNPRILYGSERLPLIRGQRRMVFVVEGEKDCDNATALGLASLCNPEGATEEGQRPKWQLAYSEQLRGLDVVLIADNDRPGRAHAQAAAARLHGTAATVRVIELPGETVKDLSDWIAEGKRKGRGTEDLRADLERQASEVPLWRPDEEPAGLPEVPYRRSPEGLIWMKPLREGTVRIPLTNFDAVIVGEEVHDDGAEVQRFFEIEARHRGWSRRFRVGASQFPGLGWISQHLGPTAVLYAGSAIKDHARAAIQLLSQGVERRTVYAHLGWRELEGRHGYLHAGGAIGAGGSLPGIEVDLPYSLQRFALPRLPSGKELAVAIRASLKLLDLAPDEVAFPVYAAIWRAVVGPADFGLHVSGRTGQGKSELAALAQQHFGPGMDARHLPGSWSSTANSLETLAFSAKDALLVVDDFAPEGSAADIHRVHREAARLLRAQGNQAGRGRLRAEGTLKTAKPPRGLILSTGEDTPRGQSIQARLLVLELPEDAMEWERLTACQAEAAEGLYAQALAGFLEWLAPRYRETQELRCRRIRELREQAMLAGKAHRRTPAIVAELTFGLELFLAFARDAGVLEGTEAAALRDRGWAALARAAQLQTEDLSAAEPTRRFLDLLRSALVSGRAHAASDDGAAPENPRAWGWRPAVHGDGGGSPAGWLPQGDRIGWLRGETLYLDPGAAYQAAQRMTLQDPLPLQPKSLWKRLKERGVLAETDSIRGRNLVRATVQGARREVLHLSAATLMPQESSQSSQSSQDAESTWLSGPILWADSGPDVAETAQRNGPETPVDSASVPSPGTIGTIGTILGTGTGGDEDWGVE